MYRLIATQTLRRTEEICRQSIFLCNMKTRNRLITHANYDAENLTKQTDADLHNMQEQVFAGA